MLWRNKTEVSVDSFSIKHINVEVSIPGSTVFRLTSMYGEPNRARRRLTWNLICHLARIIICHGVY